MGPQRHPLPLYHTSTPPNIFLVFRYYYFFIKHNGACWGSSVLLAITSFVPKTDLRLCMEDWASSRHGWDLTVCFSYPGLVEKATNSTMGWAIHIPLCLLTLCPMLFGNKEKISFQRGPWHSEWELPSTLLQKWQVSARPSKQ